MCIHKFGPQAEFCDPPVGWSWPALVYYINRICGPALWRRWPNTQQTAMQDNLTVIATTEVHWHIQITACFSHQCGIEYDALDSQRVSSQWQQINVNILEPTTPFPPRSTNSMLVGWLASGLENVPFFRSPKYHILATRIHRKFRDSVLRATIHPRLLCPFVRFSLR